MKTHADLEFYANSARSRGTLEGDAYARVLEAKLRARGVEPDFENGMRKAKERMEKVRIKRKFHTPLDTVAELLGKLRGTIVSIFKKR